MTRLALFACLLALFRLLPAAAQEMPRAEGAPGYIGSQACAGCHAEAAEAWAGSHHALAWTLPDAGHLLGDFNDTRFEQGDMSVRFRTAPDGRPHVEVTELDGTTTDYPVHSVVGIAPLQQYLLETAPGRLQSFDVVWDTERGGWFHLYPDTPLPPSDGLHWTGPYKNWNGRCATCHATGYSANYDLATRSYASEWSEIGVGCEACHGPGAAHAAWAEQPSSPVPPNHGFSARLAPGEGQIEACAGCHSRREAFLDGNPLPGTPYADAYSLSQLRPGLYHADGQILDEVYVYGSFLQSKMYASGVSCSDCHAPHSARLRAEGNALCTTCHAPEADARFPAAGQAVYDSPEHHFHAPGSPGAQCRACHMVEQVYMGNDWRADHSFRIPRPDLAATTGAPDACTTCHAGRDPAWAAERIAAWYPDSAHRGPHYGEVLARGREDPAAAAPALTRLARDGDMPGIIRATALWLLEQSGTPEDAAGLAALLEDPDPVVREAALGAQRLAGPQARAQRVIGLLDDPARSVRMAAARQLLDAPIAHLPPRYATRLRSAMAEWQQALGQRMDFPETSLQLGGMALTMRNIPAANRAFREAVTLDPQRVEAWVMLSRIAAATEGAAAALAIVDEALAAAPGDFSLRSMRAELTGQAPNLLPPPPPSPSR
ncbi:multiheme c-type cytochrome [Oceanicella sp. SM1341]|uniref:cytochrome c3 family protein n=1 Tax=Oceanicella sp. SM1341 TaxID=1548889 RepID=UPI0018E56DB6|nr:multiheme c-type cytochrome [Oceanicella sp. SM1341]